jgi:hypothetical protein
VKPITYQHQAGEIWAMELEGLRGTILRDFAPDEATRATRALFRILGLKEGKFCNEIHDPVEGAHEGVTKTRTLSLVPFPSQRHIGNRLRTEADRHN